LDEINMQELTGVEYQALAALADANDRFCSGRGPEFLRPKDLGRNFGPSLMRLEKFGLTVSRERPFNAQTVLQRWRRSSEYAITPAGLAAHAGREGPAPAW
jgi:hypothetical protein